MTYDISGAGGGGGASCTHATANPTTNVGGDGGTGTRLQGVIPASPTGYTLYISVGQGGNRGVIPTGSAEQNKGLSIYGSGGKGAGVMTSAQTYPGRGGGGGGATAISDATNFAGALLVVAPGGGGGGGRGTHWDQGMLNPNGGGALMAGTSSGSVVNGVNGHMSQTGSTDGNSTNPRPGEGGQGATTTVGTGGRSAAQYWGDTINYNGGWPGFNGGDREQNQSPGYQSANYGLMRVSDGGGGGVDGYDTTTNGWDGGGGGGGGGGYRGGGGGGGGKGWNFNGAGDGGGGASGSAIATGAGTATASTGAAAGTGGTSMASGNDGLDGWVKLTW